MQFAKINDSHVDLHDARMRGLASRDHTYLFNLPSPTCIYAAMDLHTLIQALGNTLDPALQKEAETFLDKVSNTLY